MRNVLAAALLTATVLLVAGSMFFAPSAAAQDHVPYIEYGATGVQYADNVTVLDGTEATLASGWYLASGTLTYSSTLAVSGSVSLILEDGCAMTVNGAAGNPGIMVGGSDSLTIYAQSKGSSAGSLNSSGDISKEEGGAGIGTGYLVTSGTAGDITIKGGNIRAAGGGGSAGIGGGFNVNGGNITISGGDIVAIGGGGPRAISSGAGIGGGGGGIRSGMSGGNIIITGDANVTASVTDVSRTGGAGIGGGGGRGDRGPSGDITIDTTGTVIATGGIGNTSTGADIGTGGADTDSGDNNGKPYYPSCTVSFSVTDAGSASGSTVSATYGGRPISSGSSVYGGQTLVVTAAGAGAGTGIYSYAWSGEGASGQTTQSLRTIVKSSDVDVLCTVTDSAVIPSASVTVAAPATGTDPDTAAATDDAYYSCSAVAWQPNDVPFKPAKRYTASVTLTAADGYTFSEDMSATINGNPATVSGEGSVVVLSYQFQATDKMRPTLVLGASSGQGSATLTAAISSSDTPGGKTIVFTKDGATLGTAVTDASGAATYQASGLTPATYDFGASFAGDAYNYAAESRTEATIQNIPSVQVKEYYIKASSDAGTKISPEGTVNVPSGASQTFMFSAPQGYALSAVTVDDVPLTSDQMASGSYTFYDVHGNHTISVTSRNARTDITLRIDIAKGSGYAEYSVNGDPFVRYSGTVSLPEFCSLDVRAYADDGCSFSKWTAGGVSDASQQKSFSGVGAPIHLDLYFTEESSIPWLIVIVVLAALVIVCIAAAVILRGRKTK